MFYVQIERFVSCHIPPHTSIFLHSQASLVITCIAGVSTQHVHKVLRNDPIQLFRRMKHIIPQKGVWRVRGNVGACRAVEVAMMLETCNVGWRGPVEVGRWVFVDVEDL